MVLSECTCHCNSRRPYRTGQQGPPAGRPHPLVPGANVRVLRRNRLGGVIRGYRRGSLGGPPRRSSRLRVIRGPSGLCHLSPVDQGVVGEREGEGGETWFAKLTASGVDVVEYNFPSPAGVARPRKYW